jgi:hypothetical protein
MAAAAALCLALAPLACTSAADEPAAAPADAPDAGAAAQIPWLTDYAEATRQARALQRPLLVYFYGPADNAARQTFEREALVEPVVAPRRDRYVWLRVPLETTITVGGQPIVLARHPAFANLRGRQGLAIVDYAHADRAYFGYVVSEFPFTSPKYYSRRSLEVILDLPAGTLTQRTMIYAVRTHPEAPASAWGDFNNVLAAEAESHSRYQAQIHVQGHHSWETRFHRINSRLPGDFVAQEVVAESWPDEELVDAAVECVHSWRQSEGHWDAVRRRQPLFGFDIKRGLNGIWYATGIFGRRR